jgi:hypothetical protein
MHPRPRAAMPRTTSQICSRREEGDAARPLLHLTRETAHCERVSRATSPDQRCVGSTCSAYGGGVTGSADRCPSGTLNVQARLARPGGAVFVGRALAWGRGEFVRFGSSLSERWRRRLERGCRRAWQRCLARTVTPCGVADQGACGSSLGACTVEAQHHLARAAKLARQMMADEELKSRDRPHQGAGP